MNVAEMPMSVAGMPFNVAEMPMSVTETSFSSAGMPVYVAETPVLSAGFKLLYVGCGFYWTIKELREVKCLRGNFLIS